MLLPKMGVQKARRLSPQRRIVNIMQPKKEHIEHEYPGKAGPFLGAT